MSSYTLTFLRYIAEVTDARINMHSTSTTVKISPFREYVAKANFISMRFVIISIRP